MSKRANPALIGGFVIGAVVLAVVVIVIFGSGDLFKDKVEYVIYFRGAANGLKIGAPVKLKGIEVGTVKTISLITDEQADFFVETFVEVDPALIKGNEKLAVGDSEAAAIERLIEFGFRARLEVQSLLVGNLYIKLDYFPNTEIVMSGLENDCPEIPSIMTSQKELQNALKGVLDGIKDLRMDELTTALLVVITDVDSLLRDMNLGEATGEFQAAASDLRDLLENIDSRVAPLTENIEQMTGTAAAAVAQVDSLMSSLNESTAYDRRELYAAIRELTYSARALRTLADYLERNPDAVIFGKD